VLATNVAAAQTGIITGTVTDQLNGATVPGTRIQLGTTNRFAMSNQVGHYIFSSVPLGTYQLRVAVIGFATQTRSVEVTDGVVTTADFSLARSAVTLDEVIVNPTGEERSRESGSATATVDAPKITANQTVSNTGDLLSGRTPGVQVFQSGGTVGTGTRIRIRGQSSISLSNEPVYYIDGIKVESSSNSLTVGTGGQSVSRIDDINPDDIQSVEIVKGPSAATLYGTQAANGVIRITTRHGLAGRSRWTAYSEVGALNDKNTYPTNYYSWGHRLPDTLPAIRANDTLRLVQCTLLGSTVINPPKLTPNCAIDSLTSFNVLMNSRTTPLGTGYRGQAGLQLTGGTDQFTYYVSGDYADNIGPLRLPSSEYSRLTAALGGVAPDYSVYRPNESKQVNVRSNIHVAATHTLDLTGDLGVLQSNTRLPQNDNNVTGILPSGLFGTGVAVNDVVGKTPGSALQWGFFLPGDIFQIVTQQNISRLTGSISANWLPTSWFTGRATTGLDYTGREDLQFQQRGQGPNFSNFRQGRVTDNRFSIYHYTTDLGGTATFQLRPEVLSKTSLGFQFLKDNSFGILANGQVLPPGGQTISGASIRTATEATVTAVTLGSYVEQEFGWRDRVFITGGLRNDRNSAFGSQVRSVYYPKIQGSWVVSDESFFPRTPMIDNLRVRFAYGASGQQPGTTDALLFYAAQTAAIRNLGDSTTGADQPGIDLTAFGNTNLKPERSAELELGFDAGIYRDIVRLEVTYYNKKTHDALVNVPLPPSNGIAASRFVNLGSTQNKGIEIQLDMNKVVGSGTTVDATLGFSYNANKLLTLGPGISPVVNGVFRETPGYPLFGFWDRPIVSFADANGDGIIEPSEVVVGPTATFLGSSIPKTNVTLNAGVTFLRNRLRLGGQLDYRGNYLAYNNTEVFRCTGAGFDCAAINNPKASLQDQARAVAASTAADGKTQAGYIENGKFLRLRELSLTYFAPDKWAQAIGAEHVQLALTGRNLLKWTSYTGVDPELNGNGQSDLVDDFLTAPPVRTLALRVTVNF
jgi:TonB-linked SusC/RagA family outer membrane protein